MDALTLKLRMTLVLISFFLIFPVVTYAQDPMINDWPRMMLAMNNTFIFNPRTRTWVAIDSRGHVVKSGRGSGGSNYCPDIHRSCHTPTGTFHVLNMRGADCVSTRYPVGRGGAKMPYCNFFTQFYAVHGSYEVKSYNASHGCIRIQPDAARWLQRHFFRIGTTVIVKPY